MDNTDNVLYETDMSDYEKRVPSRNLCGYAPHFVVLLSWEFWLPRWMRHNNPGDDYGN